MTPEKLEMYQKQLLNLNERIGRELDDLVESFTGGQRVAGDHTNSISDSQEADIVVGKIDESLQAEVRAALERIKNNTFGVCVDCGGRIVQARLDAIPYTPVCIACETIREKR